MTYRRALILLAIVTVAMLGQPGHAAAKYTTFKQLILPIDCQFQIVDTGLGTVVYLTPAACGQQHPDNGNPGGQGSSGNHGNASGGNSSSSGNHKSDVPGQSKPKPGTANNASVDNRQTAIVPPPAAVGTSLPQTLQLNTKPKAYEKEGYQAKLSLGSTISYLPRHQSSGSPHTLTVTNITAAGITVLMQPSGQFIEIPVGRTIYLDFDNNGNPAIEVRVLGATTDGHARLNIHLVDNKNSNEIKGTGINPLLQVFAVIVIAFTLISLSNFFWKRRLERKETP